MQRYILVMSLVTVLAVGTYIALMLGLPNRIAAEYWLRETIIVKQDIAERQKGSRVILMGGSGVLFGIDAAQMEKGIGRPVVNFGLHAGVRLDRMMELAEEAARPGDLILFSPEHSFYGCDKNSWSPWAVRSSLTWDRDSFEQRPLTDRISAVLSPGGRGVFYETVADAIGMKIWPDRYHQRNDTMVHEQHIVDRFHSGERETEGFAYSAYNLDKHGNMKNTHEAKLTEEPDTGHEPKTICEPTLQLYADFVADMRARNVPVVFAHAPYMIETTPTPEWRDHDHRIASQLKSIGSDIVTTRDQVFFPRSAFFDVARHLNAEGRARRTAMLIDSLLDASVLPPLPAIPADTTTVSATP